MQSRRVVGEIFVPFYAFVRHEGDGFTLDDLVAWCGLGSSEDLLGFVSRPAATERGC